MSKNLAPYQYLWITFFTFLLLITLTSCGSMSTPVTNRALTEAVQTAMSDMSTAIAETQTAIPNVTLTVTLTPSPSPIPFTETSVPVIESSPIPASGIPTIIPVDDALTWMECVLPRRDYAYSTDMEFVTTCLKKDQPTWNDHDKKLQGERIDVEHGVGNFRLIVGGDIYETRYSRGEGGVDYELLKNGGVIANTTASWTTFDPNRNLWNIGGKVVWEVANPSVLIVDGVNQNEEYQFEETYFPYEIQSKLIYIARKNGKYHVVYDERIIGPGFDWIYLGYCCGYTNVHRGGGQYWFWGKRKGTSFVVAIQ